MHKIQRQEAKLYADDKVITLSSRSYSDDEYSYTHPVALTKDGRVLELTGDCKWSDITPKTHEGGKGFEG